MSIDYKIFPKDPASIRANTLGRVPRANLPAVLHLIEMIRREEHSEQPMRRAVCESLFVSLLMHLARSTQSTQASLQDIPVQKEIDFIARNMKDTFYIQVSYTLIDEKTREREINSFRKLDDGYKKIVITMDNDPFIDLGFGYKKMNIIDFLLDDASLEKA